MLGKTPREDSEIAERALELLACMLNGDHIYTGDKVTPKLAMGADYRVGYVMKQVNPGSDAIEEAVHGDLSFKDLCSLVRKFDL